MRLRSSGLLSNDPSVMASSSITSGSHAPISLGASQVHIWWATISDLQPRLERFAELLSADELYRLRRFRFAEHRARFIASRGMLRLLLSKYLGVEPDEIRLCEGSNGKPRIQLPIAGREHQFSLSHSADLVACAFAREMSVGVDVERIRADYPWSDVAGLCFTPREQSWLASLPDRSANEAGFAIWTRKEAYLKATGAGIGGLLEVQLPLAPPDVCAGRDISPPGDSEDSWCLYDPPLLPGYQVSLVAAGSAADIQVRIVRFDG